MAIGKTPKNLDLGIYSGEVSSYSECFDENLQTIYTANDTCRFNKLSCRYIQELGDDIATRKYYSSEEAAYADARKAKTVGYIYFSHNFSASVYEFIEDSIYASDGAIDNAEIVVHIDMTGESIHGLYKNLSHFILFSLDCLYRSTSWLLHATKTSWHV